MARINDRLAGIGAFTALSLIVAACWLCAIPAAAQHGRAGPPASAASAASAPDVTVRQFYDWYLGELKAGRRPFDDDATMQAYFTREAIAEFHRTPLMGIDPVLALPEPRSRWVRMRVTVGRPQFYHRPGFADAYVEVTYRGITGQTAPDPWTVGLKRTALGWRIDTIGINE